jgi:Xaa-Pro aminopeptidase
MQSSRAIGGGLFRLDSVSREFSEKLDKVRALLKKKRKSAALITRQPNFSWLGCGAEARVAINTDKAAANWLVTKEEVYLLSNGIELPRLKAEALSKLEYEPVEYEWHNPDGLEIALKEVVDPKKVLSDSDDLVSRPQPAAFAELRYSLCKEEVARLRHLGKAMEAAMSATAYNIRVDESENEIAAQMIAASVATGITPVVVLVAVDDRIKQFRHPLPTDRKLKRHAMLIMCARYQGLIASMTRTVYFGDIPDALARRHKLVCTVDVALQRATTIGAVAGEILTTGIEKYKAVRFADEWEKHHQGGPCGYLPREYIVTPQTGAEVEAYQPFAWNPTIAGTKSEDTILITPKGPELITKSQDWPRVDVVVDKKKASRYAILDR